MARRMTEITNPDPEQPQGASTPNTGNPAAASGSPSLLDAGDSGTAQWGPSRDRPVTDAADTGDRGDDPTVRGEGRSVAGDDDALAPQATGHPESVDAGRADAASGSLGGRP